MEEESRGITRRERYDKVDYHKGIQREAELRRQLADGEIVGLVVDLRSDSVEIEYRLATAQP